MKYIIDGAKNTNRFYDGNLRYWLLGITYIALITWDYIFYNEEFLTVFIKDSVWFWLIFGIIQLVAKPKSFLFLNFEIDSLEIGYLSKKHNKTIAYSNLKSIDTTMTDVVIKTNDGRTLKVPLSHFFYTELIAIKKEVFNLQEKLTNSLELLATE